MDQDKEPLGRIDQAGQAAQGAVVAQAGRDLYLTVSALGRDAAVLEPASPLVPPRRRIPSHFLRGRETLLRELTILLGKTSLQQAFFEDRRRVHVIHGLGGVGKTTVAIELAWRAHAAGISVWWVSAHDSSQLVSSMHSLAYQVGAEDLAHVHPADALWKSLNSRAEPWLLVLDNVDDVAMLELPGCGSVSDGRGWLRPPATNLGLVVVTTRDGRQDRWSTAWDSGWCTLQALAPLGAQDAALALMDRTPAAGTVVEAEELATRLGNLPLALDLAGAYLRTAGNSLFPDPRGPVRFTDYLVLLNRSVAAFDDRWLRLMVDSGVSQEAHEGRRTMATTWELSLGLLERQGQEFARPIFRLLSSFGPAPLPYILVLDSDLVLASPLMTGLTPERLGETMRSLAGVGLITLTEQPGISARELVGTAVLHPLVRETSRTQPDFIDDIAQYFALVVDLMDRATRHLEPRSVQDWPQWAVLAPHAWAAADLLAKVPNASTEQIVSATSLPHQAARYQRAMGLHAQAEAGLRVVLEIRQRLLGADDRHTIETLHELGVVLRDRGRYFESESSLTRALSVRTELLGPDAPETLDSRHEVAVVLRDQGRYRQAEEEYRQVLTKRQAVLRENHPSTLETLYQLAVVLRDLRQLADAESAAQASLEKRREVLGREHPATLLSQHILARTLDDSGRYDEAEREYRAVLEARHEALGDYHPDTLTTRSHLAQLLTNGEDREGYEEAEAEYRLVLEAQTRVLGHDHPSTLTTRFELARVLAALGDTDRAADEFGRVHEIRQEVLGADHPDAKLAEQELLRVRGVETGTAHSE